MSSTTSTSSRKKLSHRPLALSSNHWVENGEAPIFTSSFGSAAHSAPRRQPPTLNDITFGDISSMDDSMPVFRQPGSTERALAALSQAKYERMERRRAMILLGVLLLVAVAMHATSNATSKYSNSSSQASKVDNDSRWNFRNKDPSSSEQTSSTQLAEPPDPASASGAQSSPEAEEDPVLAAFQSLEDSSTPSLKNDIPVFWHIPRCAGALMKHITGTCLGLTLSSEEGVRDGHQHDETLKVFTYNGVKYVNVDTTSITGIERARELGLASSEIVPVVFSSYLHLAVSLFDDAHMGRTFTMLRHPVDRSVSMYYYLQKADPSMANVPLIDYARGQGIENNWMVRYLVNQIDGDIDRTALDLAKMILKRKFVIGFLEHKEESIKRFQTYFGWEFPQDDEALAEKQSFCISSILKDGINVNTDGYDVPKKGSQEYSLIAHQNQFDIKLYDYAKEIFEEQSKSYGSKEWKKAEKAKKKASGN